LNCQGPHIQWHGATSQKNRASHSHNFALSDDEIKNILNVTLQIHFVGSLV